MNVDRLPDNTDDPRPDPEPARPTDTPAPESPALPDPPPKQHPPPHQQPSSAPESERDRQPELEREPQRKSEPEREQPPESSRAASQTDSPAPTDDTPPRAEPRSRQEHAAPAFPDEREVPVTDEVGDRGTSVAAEAAAEREVALDDVRLQEKAKQDPGSAGEPRPDDLLQREDETADNTEVSEGLEQTDTGSPDQESQLNGQASQTSSATQGEKTPGPTDAPSPVRDGTVPLTDKEWSEHVTEVRDTLDKARAAGLTTDRLYTIDPDRREWTAERNRLQSSLVADLYERAREVPCDHHAVIAGGLGGAGKTTVLAGYAGIDLSKYLTINPDEIKEEMARRGMIPEVDELSPMEASDLAHEESSYIAKRLALRAMTDGKNITWDITMSSQESTEERINNLRDAAYMQVDGVFVDIPPDISITRTEWRHREGHEQWRANQGYGGRFVPPEVIRRQLDSEWGSQNRRTYEAMKEKFNRWSIYDNSVHGRSPSLIESSEQEKPRQDDTERANE